MIGFKSLIPADLVWATPEDELIPCSECGGINAMASVAAKIDCSTCDTTGWENAYTRFPVRVSYRPGAVKRWDQVAGQMTYVGECSIKLDYSYNDLIAETKWIEMNGAQWNFTLLRDPGQSFGQHRIILALSRKD